jgi:DNA-binding response OmpR family regulator
VVTHSGTFVRRSRQSFLWARHTLWLVKSSANQLQPLRVLLVEDSERMIEQLTQLLQQLSAPIEIKLAPTFDVAISTSEQFVPDVAIVDLQLTLGSGFSVIRVLCKSTPRPRIIVLTNYGLQSYRDYALLNGADYFLDKALEFELLPGLIEMAAQQKMLSRLGKGVDASSDGVTASLDAAAAKL